jgi:hypothetical protein
MTKCRSVPAAGVAGKQIGLTFTLTSIEIMPALTHRRQWVHPVPGARSESLHNARDVDAGSTRGSGVMSPGIVPVKTAGGRDELATRARRLSQRHRTVLLLVDGRRSAGEIVVLARRAGVKESIYRELLELGLVVEPHALADAGAAPMQRDEVIAASPRTEALVDGGTRPATGGRLGSHRLGTAVVRAAFAPPSASMPLLDTNPEPLGLMPTLRRGAAAGPDAAAPDEIWADSAAAAELSREHVGLPLS